MREGSLGCNAPAWSPSQKTTMNQVGFDDIFERPLVLSNGCREGFETDGPTPELLDKGRKKDPVETVKAGFVHVQSLEREARRIKPDVARIAISHRRKVTHTAQQTVRDARGPPSAACNFVGRLAFNFSTEQAA